jgi:hypothetical protein
MSATTKTKPVPVSAVEKQRRDRVIAAAMSDRKITDQAGWRAEMDRNPVSTERLLGGLASGHALSHGSVATPVAASALLQASRIKMGAAPRPASLMASPADRALLERSRRRMGAAR